MSAQLTWVKTHCARLDHGGCALLVGVKDNRIVKIKGDPEGYANRGYVCTKGLLSAERLNHPRRLTRPLKRVGGRGEGQWAPISWDEALDLISAAFLRIKAAHGARAVVFGQGMPKGIEHFALIRLANLFGSPNVIAHQDVCHAPREVSGIHTCGFYPVADFHHPSHAVMVWGSNPTSTNEEGEICSLLLDQIHAGVPLIVVDPRRTEVAAKARCWLQLRPGTDTALALALLNVIIEEGLYDRDFVREWTQGFEDLARHVTAFTPEAVAPLTWVAPDRIRAAARLYARARPAALQWGNAIEQTRHNFDTGRALVCLMALCGNLDVPGGNIKANEPPILPLRELVCADRLPEKPREMLHAYHGAVPRLMSVPPAYFRRAVLEGRPYPVRGAYFQGTNPLAAYGESPLTHRALMALDFFAVADIFMTPTAHLADVVLPAATHFEFDDIGHAGLGHGYILARPKVVEPPPECRPDAQILNELGRRLSSPADWYPDYRGLLEDLLKPTGLNYAAFVTRGHLRGPDRFRKYLGRGFKTPSGKVELSLSRADRLGMTPLPQFDGLPEPEDPDYPLVLTSCKSRFYLHSSYRWVPRLRRHRPLPRTEIHPDTAYAHGITDGDEVVIETRHGAILQTAHLTDRVHPRVINAAYGWWFGGEEDPPRFDWQRANFNMLTSTERLGQAFGTPNLKGIGCRIRVRETP